ncbi:putative methyltransferase C3H7.11 [Vitis vinifera]|uniref:Putative methyltransferase C3H7.11 n=1 Tax=Vitis vinifera TaxID=29760 RepID=A0A438HV37_VITVI|nr:putative methyltransferase C3H7.11 [Vitis vinifera]
MQNNNHQGYRYTLHLVLEFPLSGERSMKGRLRSIGMSSTSDIKTESASVITLNFLIIAISKGIFKDRHYLDKEWGHYFSGAGRKVILEVGCGAGNTIFPLVATYPDIFVHACDFSPRAVDLVKETKMQEMSKRIVRSLGVGRGLKWGAINSRGAFGGVLVFGTIGPWCVAGDFNVVRFPMECSKGGRLTSSKRRFFEIIEDLELRTYTSSRRRKASRISYRLGGRVSIFSGFASFVLAAKLKALKPLLRN